MNLDDLVSPRMSQWSLVETGVAVEVKTYDCCPEPYQSMMLSFKIKRSLSTSSALITPTLGTLKTPFMLIVSMQEISSISLFVYSNYGSHIGHLFHSTGGMYESNSECGQFGHIVRLLIILLFDVAIWKF